MEQPEALGVNVGESVKTTEAFGPEGRPQQPTGIAGTLQATSKEQLPGLGDAAWELSLKSGKPVVIVVRAPRQPGT